MEMYPAKRYVTLSVEGGKGRVYKEKEVGSKVDSKKSFG